MVKHQPVAAKTSKTKAKKRAAASKTPTRKSAKEQGESSATSRRKAKVSTAPAVSSTGATKPSSSSSSSSKQKQKQKETRVLSDEDSENGDMNAVEEESDSDDHDRQLGLRPTLRVVSKATVRKTWRQVNIKTRSHIQALVSGLFPAAITRARGEKKKIAVQITLNQLMQKLNDCLSELDVPPQGKERINYMQLNTRNKELEAMLVPDLEHIRNLELRLDQEKILAEQDENELERFLEKKRALDQRTKNLQRYKLHPLLRDSSIVDTMASLCQADNDFGHLSVADQRLMSTMPMLKDEDFSGSEVRESAYNPDQDLKINKASKRLGNRLSAIERNGEGLDPLMQLMATAQSKVQELSAVTLSSTKNTGHQTKSALTKSQSQDKNKVSRSHYQHEQRLVASDDDNERDIDEGDNGSGVETGAGTNTDTDIGGGDAPCDGRRHDCMLFASLCATDACQCQGRPRGCFLPADGTTPLAADSSQQQPVTYKDLIATDGFQPESHIFSRSSSIRTESLSISTVLDSNHDIISNSDHDDTHNDNSNISDSDKSPEHNDLCVTAQSQDPVVRSHSFRFDTLRQQLDSTLKCVPKEARSFIRPATLLQEHLAPPAHSQSQEHILAGQRLNNHGHDHTRSNDKVDSSSSPQVFYNRQHHLRVFTHARPASTVATLVLVTGDSAHTLGDLEAALRECLDDTTFFSPSVSSNTKAASSCVFQDVSVLSAPGDRFLQQHQQKRPTLYYNHQYYPSVHALHCALMGIEYDPAREEYLRNRPLPPLPTEDDIAFDQELQSLQQQRQVSPGYSTAFLNIESATPSCQPPVSSTLTTNSSTLIFSTTPPDKLTRDEEAVRHFQRASNQSGYTTTLWSKSADAASHTTDWFNKKTTQLLGRAPVDEEQEEGEVEEPLLEMEPLENIGGLSLEYQHQRSDNL
ncbi:hypothetical protein BG011_010196 [Mortierella polycephala]|uniref:Uncharacterized protein n=1 Tax=Mortierella polycephala TaxID=41804 RepID=A0A9P6Q9R4_9FUNG|nr:hypothetical protein BG011_010196 [Mortierella polycephala]